MEMIYCNGNKMDANYVLKVRKRHCQTGLKVSRVAMRGRLIAKRG
jgi:hypothetical protein